MCVDWQDIDAKASQVAVTSKFHCTYIAATGINVLDGTVSAILYILYYTTEMVAKKHTQLHRLKEKRKTYSTHIVRQITKEKKAKICNVK